MKRIMIKFFLSLLLVLAIQSSATAKESSFFTPSYTTNAPAAFEQQETKKPTAAAEQKVKKPNLWKTLLSFLKLKTNTKKKLDDKVLQAIEKLGITDSIAATATNVRIMTAALKKKTNPDIDSLSFVLSDIIQKQEALSKKLTDAESATPTNADLAALASQLIPILDKKVAAAKDNSGKYEKIRILNRVKSAGPQTIYSVKISDSITKRYTLQLKNKAEIFGFFDAAYPVRTDAFFNAATALIYYALPVNTATGNFNHQNGWATTPVIDAAQKAGSKVYFTAIIAGKNTKSSLLFNQKVQKKCIANIVNLLQKRNANGINISFKNLPKPYKKQFAEFIRFLNGSLHEANPSYKVFITLPRTNFDGAYDLEELSKHADRFFIDFASNTSSKAPPLAPLTGSGKETIDASYTWYLAHGITAEKLVIILPYRGVLAGVDPISLTPNLFGGYLPFNQIKDRSQSNVLYSSENETAYIDRADDEHGNHRIWYDDEVTLSKKYDYILKNNVAGVGIYYINYDDDYAVLNDELMYKFTYVDTNYVKAAALLDRPKLSFLQKMKRHVVLWNFILQNPCATCFENTVNNPHEKAQINTYINDLNIYNLIKEKKRHAAKKSGSKQNAGLDKISLGEVFHYVDTEFNTFLKYLSLIFLALSIGGIILYIWGLKYYGNHWQYQKLAAGILFLLIPLSALLGFTFCFTSDLIPIIGTSAIPAGSPECSIDTKCINVPFNTLLFIILLSVVLGFLIFNYLITPLIKRNDLP